MYKAFGDKLMEVTERHAAEISEKWCKAIKTNNHTPSYHSYDMESCVLHAMEFYKNIGRIYFSKKPYKEVEDFFSTYAENRYSEGIPLEEALYALIMMRRHIWLNAEAQAVFMTALDQHQAVEGINRTIRIFDHGIFIVTRKYEEKRTIDK